MGLDPFSLIFINLLIGAALWGIGMLLRRPTHQEGPRIKDKRIQVSTYGTPKPILYGQCKPAMVLIGATPLREHKHEEEVGKGGGATVTTYTYSCTWGGLFGVTPDPAIFGELLLLKLWTDEKLVYNATADADKVVSGAIMKRFKYYSGVSTQLPDPTLEAVYGSDNVPAYRMRPYGVWNNADVTPYGNRLFTTRALLAPGTPAAYGFYPVEGAEETAPFCCENEECVLALNQNEMFLYWGQQDVNSPGDDIFTWRKIDTYSRKVLVEQVYSQSDSIFSGKGDYTWYMSGDFAVDELDRIYAAASGGTYVTRLDGSTFTIQKWSPDGFETIPEQVRVSRNPLYPYLWITDYDTIELMDRETLTSPFDASLPSHSFLSPATAPYPASIDIDNGDGGLWALYLNASYLSTATIAIMRKLLPDGSYQEWDISTILVGSVPLEDCLDALLFDSATNQIAIGVCNYNNGNGKIIIIDCDTMTIASTVSISDIDSIESIRQGFKRGVVGGYLYLLSDYGKIIKLNMNDYSYEIMADISSELPETRHFYSGIYLSYKSSMYVGMIKDNINVYEATLGRLTTGTVGLDDVVSDICKRAGLTDSQLNVAQLTDEVKGYMVDTDQSAREALEPLMEAYIFDGTEVDGVLEFVKRGGASVLTIPEADLAAFSFGSDRPEPLEIEGQDEIADLPRRVEVLYPDIDRKHESGIQDYERQLTDSKLIKRITTPILMDKDQAKQLAHIKLRYDWLAKPCTLSLGPKYARLAPTDVVTVQKSEGDYRVLLTEAQRQGLLTNWKGIIEDFEYTSDAEGNPGPPVDEDVAFPGPSLWQLMDLPPLLEAHDQAGAYLASGALFDGWTGCNIHVSKDNGDSWVWLQDLTARATTGVATAALGDFSNRCFDHGNSLTVRWDMEGDVLSSKTQAQFLNGQAHYILVGDEIVCAKDVTTNPDGTQVFGPPLIRGARGTEYAMTGHNAGDRVVVLTTTTCFFATLDSSYLNQSYLYNGISHGEAWEDGVRKKLLTELRTLKPWAGVQAEGTRDGSDNFTTTWRRRDRFGYLNPWRAGVEVPMSETAESYEVDFYDGDTVVRTKSGLATPSCTYSAAEQTADGLTPGDPIKRRHYQISSVTGRGWPLEATD